MKLSAAIAIGGSALAASQAAQAGREPFGIMALRPDSSLQFAKVGASQGYILINLRDDDAVCEIKPWDKVPSQATFYINDGVLYLYTNKEYSTDKTKVQRLFVDLSDAGQGRLGYHRLADIIPDYCEVNGWKVDKTGNLSFNGNELIACPVPNKGSWTIWAGNATATPGGNKGCLGFSARTIPSNKPVPCEYSLFPDRIPSHPWGRDGPS